MLDHSAFLAQLAEAREHSANGDYSSAVVYYDGVIDQLSRSLVLLPGFVRLGT